MSATHPTKLGWRDAAGITHKLMWDDDLIVPMWVTACDLGPITGSILITDLAPHEPDCMGCLGHAREIIKCHRCGDTGYLDFAWADFPCSCKAGDVARFEIVDVDGATVTTKTSVTGEYLKSIIGTWRRK